MRLCIHQKSSGLSIEVQYTDHFQSNIGGGAHFYACAKEKRNPGNIIKYIGKVADAMICKEVIEVWYLFLIMFRITIKAKLLIWVELFEYVTRKCTNL